MKPMTLLLAVNVLLCNHALGGDIMVERMQSVIDEVSDLRLRYESSVRKNDECQNQLEEQQKIITKISRDEGVDYRVFEENRKRMESLESENKRLKEALKTGKKDLSLEKELSALEKENKRLNASALILVEKNHALLAQINKMKNIESISSDDELKSLRKQVKELESKVPKRVGSPLQTDEYLALVQEKSSLEKRLSEIEERNKELDSKNIKLQNDIKEYKANIGIDSRSDRYEALEREKEVLQRNLEISISKECKPKPVPKVKKVCADDNPFPKLLMKEDRLPQPEMIKEKIILPHKIEEEPVIDITPQSKAPESSISAPKSAEEVMSVLKSAIVVQKPGTYRVIVETPVYNAPDGNVIEIWEEKTSFTSNALQGEWIKITGYFVEKKWKKSREEMWVKLSNTLKR